MDQPSPAVAGRSALRRQRWARQQGRHGGATPAQKWLVAWDRHPGSGDSRVEGSTRRVCAPGPHRLVSRSGTAPGGRPGSGDSSLIAAVKARSCDDRAAGRHVCVAPSVTTPWGLGAGPTGTGDGHVRPSLSGPLVGRLRRPGPTKGEVCGRDDSDGVPSQWPRG